MCTFIQFYVYLVSYFRKMIGNWEGIFLGECGRTRRRKLGTHIVINVSVMKFSRIKKNK